MKKGAIISDCGRYRYQLWRIWNEDKPLCMWLMHNPSKADAIEGFRNLIHGFVNSLNRDSVQYKVAKRYGLIRETGIEVKFYFEL